MYQLKRLLRKLKNLKRWFKIIWKDEQWDYGYIYDILEFKLKLVLEEWETVDHYVGQKRDVEYLKTILRLLNRVKTEYYNTEYLDYKYWNKLEDYFNKYPKQFKNLKLDDYNRTRQAMKIGDINHQKAKKLLFKLLDYRMEYFWM